MMGDFYNFGFGGMYGFGGIFMLVVWILVIWGIIALVKYLSTNNQPANKEDKALAILKERYAKGLINKDEYEEKKEVLKD